MTKQCELCKRLHDDFMWFYYLEGRTVGAITFDKTEAAYHSPTMDSLLPRTEKRTTTPELAEQFLLDHLRSINVEITSIRIINETPSVKYGEHWLDASPEQES